MRSGSSASAVPMPTRMPSIRPRSSCTSRREAGDDSQRSSLDPVAKAPSRLIAHLAITHGRPRSTKVRKGAVRRVASCSRRPTSTVSPARSSATMPPPATAGNGSRAAITTRLMPAAITASVQGGVLPWWQQGSSVTKSVAPRARGPAASNAMISACGPPKSACHPSPMTCWWLAPSRTATTAPTIGLGSTRPSPRRASSNARVIAAVSYGSNIG